MLSKKHYNWLQLIYNYMGEHPNITLVHLDFKAFVSHGKGTSHKNRSKKKEKKSQLIPPKTTAKNKLLILCLSVHDQT